MAAHRQVPKRAGEQTARW